MWHLGSRENRVVEAKEISIQLKTKTTAAKESISNYIEASAVQMYKIDEVNVVGQLYLHSLSEFTYV